MLVFAVLVLTACSSPEPGKPEADPSSAPSSAPVSAPPSASAFCLDLEIVQLGLSIYRSDLLKALRGEQQLDVEAARYRADTVVRVGDRMRSSAPPEIAAQFGTVLAAMAESAGRLSTGVVAAAEPIARAESVGAFQAVSGYHC